MVHLKLIRRNSTFIEQTIGTLEIYKDGKFVGMLMTLERGWKDNEKGTSSIPKGMYTVKHFTGQLFKTVFEVCNVPNREAILIHAGNFNINTRGCILVGLTWTDINDDGLLDVTYSQEALALLRKYLKGEKDIQLLIS